MYIFFLHYKFDVCTDPAMYSYSSDILFCIQRHNDIDLWPGNSKINRGHLIHVLNIIYMCEEHWHNRYTNTIQSYMYIEIVWYQSSHDCISILCFQNNIVICRLYNHKLNSVQREILYIHVVIYMHCDALYENIKKWPFYF